MKPINEKESLPQGVILFFAVAHLTHMPNSRTLRHFVTAKQNGFKFVEEDMKGDIYYVE